MVYLLSTCRIIMTTELWCRCWCFILYRDCTR